MAQERLGRAHRQAFRLIACAIARYNATATAIANGGLRPAQGQPACREAVSPHVERDDGGDRRQNQTRDQPAPPAQPDAMPRISP